MTTSKSILKSRVFVNSMPKSGTFLLARTVQLLGYQDFAKNTSILKKGLFKLGLWVPASFSYENINKNIRYKLSKHSEEQIYVKIGVMSPLKVSSSLCESWLRKIPDGFFLAGHVPYTETFESIIKNLGYRHILIIRDPRDVLISMAHYISTPKHPLNKIMSKLLFHERIQFLMTGGVVENRVILSFKDALMSILKWRETNDCIIVRFEDLIGERGGGSKFAAIMTIKRIAEYLDMHLTEAKLEQIYNNIFDTSSPTFRKGKVASWKDELSLELLHGINEEMKQSISDLGYEI